jgi:hypothetical protein
MSHEPDRDGQGTEGAHFWFIHALSKLERQLGYTRTAQVEIKGHTKVRSNLAVKLCEVNELVHKRVTAFLMTHFFSSNL